MKYQMVEVRPPESGRTFRYPGNIFRRFPSLLRSPLLHFLMLGGVLFLAGGLWQRTHDDKRITIDRFTLDRIATGYRQRFGEPPYPAALRLAVDEYIADEVLYREGINQGIDRDDEIVRRRIIQKMRFLQEDRIVPPPTTEAALQDYYRQHRARYAEGPRVSFSHLYFNVDGGESAARARAKLALADLDSGVAISGDPFPDRATFSNLNEEDAERVFGKSAFTRALFSLPPGRWSEPLTSGFGVHLLRVDSRSAPTTPPLEAVRERVSADLAQDAQQARNVQAVRRLEARYVVRLPDGMALR